LRVKRTFKARDLLAPTQSNESRSEILSRLSDEILDFPGYVSELNELLSSVPVDLKRVGEIIRAQPNLSAHLIHLCQLAMPDFHNQIANLDHGIVFLGIDQMRTLILACCMAVDIGSCYSSDQLRSFWQHSLLTASLSERIARYMNYPRSENAYRAGLFHDAGALALVRWAARSGNAKALDNKMCGELIEAERESLGMDHCYVGSLIGQVWELPADIVDVLQCHHNPQESKCDRALVGIVAAADSFCVEHGVRFQLVKDSSSVAPQEGFHQVLCRSLPGLGNDLGRNLKEILEMTYLQKINDFESGHASVFSGAGAPI
jgi:HD-like signal output (HDOD) protein